MALIVTITLWIINAGLGLLTLLLLLVVIRPALVEDWGRRRSEAAGLDFDAVLKDPILYQRHVRSRAILALVVIVPTWLIGAMFLLFLRAVIG